MTAPDVRAQTADLPAHRLTEPHMPRSGPTAYHETDATMSAREMEAHTAEALHRMKGRNEADDAQALIHATLALAWATRLGASQ